MNEGKLVPDDLMIGLVMDEATPRLEEGKSLLLDGFPRTVVQAQSLENVVHIDLVINLDIPTETIVERIADRYVEMWAPSALRRNNQRAHLLLMFAKQLDSPSIWPNLFLLLQTTKS